MPGFLYIFFCTLILVVFIEATTELICKSLIFSKVREKLVSVHPFIAAMIKCGYCTSVWVAIFPAIYCAYLFDPRWWEFPPLFVVFMLVLHRLSNYLHNFNDKYLDKFYK